MPHKKPAKPVRAKPRAKPVKSKPKAKPPSLFAPKPATRNPNYKPRTFSFLTRTDGRPIKTDPPPRNNNIRIIKGNPKKKKFKIQPNK